MHLLNGALMAVTALMLTMLLMPISVRLALALGALDRPEGRKVHTHKMPRLGGVAIAVAVVSSYLMFLDVSREIAGVLAGAAVITLTGMADDVLGLRPWQKFAGEIIAASLFISISGVALRNLGDLVGTGPIVTGSFAVPFTILAIVGVTNALNLSDGLDGLAGGLSAIACLFLGFFAYFGHHFSCLALIMALFGSILGFLYYNFYPAKVFMGDTGSLLLGYILAVVSVLLATGSMGEDVAPISMGLVLALPIVDTLLVMGRRMALGFSPFSPDKTHLHHRLLFLGLPHTAVVPIMYSLMTLFGFAAIAMMHWPEWIQISVGLLLATCIYGTVIIAQRNGWQCRGSSEWQQGMDQDVEGVPRFLTAWIGKSIPLMTWLVPLALAVPAFFLSAPNGTMSMAAMLLALVMLTLFPWSAGEDRRCLAHGLIYLGVYSLLTAYSIYAAAWMVRYMAAASLIVSVWVVLKLVFRRHGCVLFTSGFELLMIIVSWFVPVAVLKLLPLAENLHRALFIACLEAIPFSLAMKIIIRRQPRRDWLLAASLTSIMLLVGLRAHPL